MRLHVHRSCSYHVKLWSSPCSPNGKPPSPIASPDSQRHTQHYRSCGCANDLEKLKISLHIIRMPRSHGLDRSMVERFGHSNPKSSSKRASSFSTSSIEYPPLSQAAPEHVCAFVISKAEITIVISTCTRNICIAQISSSETKGISQYIEFDAPFARFSENSSFTGLN